MDQEKELLQGQITWLNGELKAKSEMLLSLSRQKGNEILELKCNLENKEDEVCCCFSRPLLSLFFGESNSQFPINNNMVSIRAEFNFIEMFVNMVRSISQKVLFVFSS